MIINGTRASNSHKTQCIYVPKVYSNKEWMIYLKRIYFEKIFRAEIITSY